MSGMRAATLTEFLMARVAEDETGAEGWHGNHCSAVQDGPLFGPCDCAGPARVLAECEAKRRIVEAMYGTLVAHYRDFVLSSLALPYADHPDYRDEWKP